MPLDYHVAANSTAMQIHIPFHWTLRTALGRSPCLFNPIFATFNYGTRLTGRTTGLVIEGFPRSGNSFSVFAFMNSGAGDMKIAHHVHSPSQIVSAARYHIPAVLLIRDPKEAVAAGIAKIGTHTLSDLLRAYTVYYRSLRRLRESFVVAPFETLTSDSGQVIDAVNRRFGTSFESIDAQRHVDLTKAFLAQERYDALSAPAGRDASTADFEGLDRLVRRATEEHSAFLAMAREDRTG
jgi:hypothetical protein